MENLEKYYDKKLLLKTIKLINYLTNDYYMSIEDYKKIHRNMSKIIKIYEKLEKEEINDKKL